MFTRQLTVCSVRHREAHTGRIQYKLVGLANLYEIFKDKTFVGALKTTKSTKILVPKVLGYTVILRIPSLFGAISLCRSIVSL